MRDWFKSLLAMIGIFVLLVGVVWVFSFADHNYEKKKASQVPKHDFVFYAETAYYGQDLNDLNHFNGKAYVLSPVYLVTGEKEGKLSIKSGFYISFDRNSIAYALKKNSFRFESGKFWLRLFPYANSKAELRIKDYNLYCDACAVYLEVDDNCFYIYVKDGNIYGSLTLEKGSAYDCKGVTEVKVIDWATKKEEQDMGEIEKRKQYYYNKYKSKLKLARMFYDVTDEMVDHYLEIAAYYGIEAARAEIEKDFGVKIPEKYLK